MIWKELNTTGSFLCFKKTQLYTILHNGEHITALIVNDTNIVNYLHVTIIAITNNKKANAHPILEEVDIGSSCFLFSSCLFIDS